MYLNSHGHYVYKQQPTCCKVCGNRTIASWLFGYPSEKVIQDQLQAKSQRKYKLGGCSIDQMYQNDLVKSWHCNQCNSDFYSEIDVIERLEKQ